MQLMVPYASDIDCHHLLFFLIQSAGMVPLEIAALKGQMQTVERLLEGGANSNHQSKVSNMYTACIYCVSVLEFRDSIWVGTNMHLVCVHMKT